MTMPRALITYTKMDIRPSGSRYAGRSRFHRIQPNPRPKNAANSRRFVKYEMALISDGMNLISASSKSKMKKEITAMRAGWRPLGAALGFFFADLFASRTFTSKSQAVERRFSLSHCSASAS